LPFPFSDPEGGGISNSGTLTLSDCTLTENESITGLAIFNSGTVTITKSRITNHSGGFSGVIVNSGTLTITKSHITDNFSDAQSAGITNDGGTVTITESTIAHNIGAHGSGGLSNIAGTVVIATTTFADNLADGAASAIHNAGTLTITDSSLTDNGIFGIATGTMTNVGMLKVTNTTFARNFAPGISSEHGVAIANYHTLILTNSTLADNVEGAFRSGSAALLSASGATTLLQNTLLARNVGSGIAGSGSDCSGVVTSLGHNLIGDPTGCTITLHPSDLTGDPGFATFTDDGTPGNGHVPLLPTSQAIDAGNDLVCSRRDQIGQRRVNIPGVGTSRCDIGAIEFPGKDDRQHDQELAATAQGSQ
jgi:hypothetical protein